MKNIFMVEPKNDLGQRLNNLGRGPTDNAFCKILKLWALFFHIRRILKIFLYISMKKMWPLWWGQNKLEWGKLNKTDTVYHWIMLHTKFWYSQKWPQRQSQKNFSQNTSCQISDLWAMWFKGFIYSSMSNLNPQVGPIWSLVHKFRKLNRGLMLNNDTHQISDLRLLTRRFLWVKVNHLTQRVKIWTSLTMLSIFRTLGLNCFIQKAF